MCFADVWTLSPEHSERWQICTVYTYLKHKAARVGLVFNILKTNLIIVGETEYLLKKKVIDRWGGSGEIWILTNG